jgi:phage terminase small subunit
MAAKKKAKQGTSAPNPAGRKLTPKQLRFCSEYLLDLNATQAAIRAGYSERTANEQAARLLVNVSIREEIDRRMVAREARTEITSDRVLQELARMAFYDPSSVATVTVPASEEEIELGVGISNGMITRPIRGPGDLQYLSDDVRRCIIGWSWDKAGNFTLKLAAKTPPLEMIGRHLKMFTDKTEVTGKDGVPLVPATATSLSPEQLAQVERIRGIREALAKPQ